MKNSSSISCGGRAFVLRGGKGPGRGENAVGETISPNHFRGLGKPEGESELLYQSGRGGSPGMLCYQADKKEGRERKKGKTKSQRVALLVGESHKKQGPTLLGSRGGGGRGGKREEPSFSLKRAEFYARSKAGGGAKGGKKGGIRGRSPVPGKKRERGRGHKKFSYLTPARRRLKNQKKTNFRCYFIH